MQRGPPSRSGTDVSGWLRRCRRARRRRPIRRCRREHGGGPDPLRHPVGAACDPLPLPAPCPAGAAARSYEGCPRFARAAGRRGLGADRREVPATLRMSHPAQALRPAPAACSASCRRRARISRSLQALRAKRRARADRGSMRCACAASADAPRPERRRPRLWAEPLSASGQNPPSVDIRRSSAGRSSRSRREVPATAALVASSAGTSAGTGHTHRELPATIAPPRPSQALQAAASGSDEQRTRTNPHRRSTAPERHRRSGPGPPPHGMPWAAWRRRDRASAAAELGARCSRP